MRDGWHLRSKLNPNSGEVELDSDRNQVTEKIIQKMQHEQGLVKGLRTILTERGLWDNRIKLWCRDCRVDDHRMNPSKRRAPESVESYGEDSIGLTN